MESFLRLGFFTMADKITDTIGKPLPYILTGAVIAAIWIYFLFIVPRKSKRYGSFTEYIHDVLNFKTMMSSGLFKILYIALAIVVLIIGFVAIFAANFMVGLIGTIILEIVVRVLFELIMVVFSIQENLILLREHQETSQLEQPYLEDEDED